MTKKSADKPEQDHVHLPKIWVSWTKMDNKFIYSLKCVSTHFQANKTIQFLGDVKFSVPEI